MKHYLLLINYLFGIPGTSNAFAISKKLGISDKIIDRAKAKLNDTNIHLEDLLKEIYENKRIIEQEKEAISQNSKQIETLKLEYEEKFENLKEKENSIIQTAKEKAANILIEAKEDANEIIKQLEKSNSSKLANSHRNTLNKKIQKLSTTNKENNTKVSKKLNKEDLKINMEVFVPALNQNGTILSISGNSCMLQVGIIKMNFKISDLAVANKTLSSQQETILKSTRKEFSVKAISPEINVLRSKC